MCHLAQASQAGFYRYLGRGWQREEELALRSAVQALGIEHRWRYGYRRITTEVRLQGILANHKRIARIMREDNLLAIRPESFQPDHRTLRAAWLYLNLASRMTLSGLNQLWAADITYISPAQLAELRQVARDPGRIRKRLYELELITTAKLT